MICTALIPDPDPLAAAAPFWLFKFLLLLTFLLHLVPMNLILGGSLLVLWARLRSKLAIREELTRWFTGMMPVAVAATVSFGVAPLLFSQVLYGRLLYSSSILIGWWWLAVIPMVIIAYYAVYLAAYREDRLSRAGSLVLSLLSAGIFTAISFVYTSNMSLMLRPGVFEAKYQSAPWGTGLNLDDPTLFSRWAHMLLGALAVAGLALAWRGYSAWKKGEAATSGLYRYGIGVFALTTAVNMVVGTIFLFSFPKEVLLELVRNSTSGTVELVAGFAGGFVALGLAVMALQEKRRPLFFGGTVVATVVTLVLMVLLRDTMREVTLVGVYERNPAVDPQWGIIALFAVLLLAALGTVGWMVNRLVVESRA